MIRRLLAAWQRRSLESEILQIDREIDAMRAWRVAEHVRERQLDQMRAESARRLQVLAQENINRRTADNVRQLVRK